MRAVFEHELNLYSRGLTAYIFGAFLMIFTGIGALMYNINASVSNFEYVLGYISIVFIIAVPLLTMRILSEEKKQKTDQLLYSLPLTTTSVIVGKFLALLVIFLVPMVIIGVYPLIFSSYGDVYLPTSYGSLAAFFFLGLALISVGMFISSLTESQGLAAGICVAVILVNYYSVTLADYISATALGALIGMIIVSICIAVIVRILTKSDYIAFGLGGVLAAASLVLYFTDASALEDLLPTIMKNISLFERFYVFVNGVFDLSVIVFYLSVIVFFLFLCVQSLEKRRYNG